MAVMRCRLADLRSGSIASRGTGDIHAVCRTVCLINVQRVNELFEKQRNTVFDLLNRRVACRPLCHLISASRYKLIAVIGEKCVKHWCLLNWSTEPAELE